MVQLGRTNRTGGPIDVADMDCMVVDDARLGGTIDRWLSFGVKSLFDEYHDLTLVKDFGDTSDTSKRMYEVCHLVRHAETGGVILMGHLTVDKGHSRFEVAKTDTPTGMKARAYCHYDVSVPNGGSFSGEKVLVHLGHDGIRALEHLGDLIALANDIRLHERRPLDLENRALIGCAHCRWIHWMSGGKAERADRFIKENGLDKFYYNVVECLGESAPGATMRFFYNTRVFWNDCDNIHVYKYDRGRIVPYGEAKVRANFHAIAGSTMYPSEAFDVPYPADRIELLKRIAPPTADTAYPVDLFVRNPAQVWNMPITRPFEAWNVIAVFNFGPVSDDFTAVLDAEKDLRLDPAKTYLVYEFWSRKFLGTFRGTFRSRAIPQKDCDVYCVVEQKERPVLLSTSRHMRQMALDVRSVVWNDNAKQLRGIFQAVSGDPYQVRIYIPDGYQFKSIERPRDLKATTTTDGALLIVDFATSTDEDVSWTVSFRKTS